jgi:sucrose-6-phosphate hydrolase SacC (GH32 family)
VSRADPYGYLLVHFVQADSADGEAIYFSLSEGDDPLRWRRLNKGKPVLSSALGTRGVRDPHVVRSPEGDRFFLVATDLNGFESKWVDATTHGSRAIEIWQSDDLVSWSAQTEVQVAPAAAGMTWAPESIWDPGSGSYFVHWTSSLYETDDHSDSQYSKVMSAYTRDFVHFTTPKVWIDPAEDPHLIEGVLDATIARTDDGYVRFVKGVDPSHLDASGAPLGDIYAERGDQLDGDQAAWSRVATGITYRATHHAPYEGPLVFRANDRSKWYLWADHYGDDFHGYVAFESEDIAADSWHRVDPNAFELPPNTKHGCVLPLIGDEWQRLYDAFS